LSPRPFLAAVLLLGGATARAQEAAAPSDGPSDEPSDAPSLFALDTVALAPFASAFPAAQATETPAGPVAVEEERWSSFLPLMKDEALARGYVLPLPIGAGATFTVLSGREIRVRDLSIRVNNEPEHSVSHIVDLGSESDVFNANLKLDAWILPFLNVYALAGYVYNESKTNVHVSVPRPPAVGGTYEFDMNVDTRLDGFVGGGGITLAGGYGDFFLVVDSNYSQTDIGFDDNFRAITASIRTGFQGKVGTLSAQFWVGGSYWDTNNVAKGHVDVPNVGRVHFAADQGPVYPWLLDLGTNLRISRGFECFADFAFDGHGGIIATVGPVFRF
jgi:hypothetical protein